VDGSSPLSFAARDEKPAIVRVLLKARASINTRDRYGWLPLHFASSGNAYESLKLLLEAKSDVNAKDKRGWTSFHYAVRDSDAVVVAELLNFGANIHEKIYSMGIDAWTLASHNTVDRENVLSLLAERRRL